jgi:UDP-glucose 4-epimerase
LKVLVTGGAGYIGSVVAAELVGAGHDVLVYDDLSKGHRDAVDPRCRFVRGDILDGDSLAGALEEIGAEAVVHLAASSLVGESVVDPGKYYRSNLQGGISVLDAMRAASTRALVFSSTAAVYGEPEAQPIDETFPTRPTNPYGETKLAFEHALRWYQAAHGISSVSLRYFNAAGATEALGEDHEPETHLIPLVLRAALGKLPEVTIFGTDYPTPDGTCVRDYIHVLDLARAHVLALEALGEGRSMCTAYNLGCGGDGYSVRQVVDTARRVTGREIPVREGPRRPGDPARLVASSSRISAELGWRPQRQDLEVIVTSAWRWTAARSV